jgi:hypothetical protein
VRSILLNLAAFDDDVEAALEYINTHPDAPEWNEWQNYMVPRGSGRTWTSPETDSGHYIFGVQGKRGIELTTVMLGKNASRMNIGPRNSGPLTRVFNHYIGAIATSVVTTPPATLDIPTGVPMEFKVSASAEAYGGIVAGYRYGWDIVDVNDDSQWETDYMPVDGETALIPGRTFSGGTHTIYIEVIDCWKLKSRIAVQLNVLSAPMARPLLLVDDFRENSPGFLVTRGARPSDAEHDAFWIDMLGDVSGFEPAVDVLETNDVVPPLEALLNYRNIVWNGYGSYAAVQLQSAFHQLAQWKDPRMSTSSGEIIPNYIALYMAAGGHVMLCGEQVVTAVINPVAFGPGPAAFPLIFRYELGGDQDGNYEDSEVGVRGIGDHSFAYSECCLNVLDIPFVGPPSSRMSPNSCPVDLIREYDRRTDGLRACLPIDVMTGAGFPRLELRPEVAEPGKFYEEARAGLNSGLYNPPYFAAMTPCGGVAEYGRSCFQPIYGNECLNNASAVFGAPVAFWTSALADRVPGSGGVAARSTVWGFDPVYFKPSQVKPAIDVILYDEWNLTPGGSLLK